MPEDFMARPTDDYVSYLAARRGEPELVVRNSLLRGRIAMGLEVVTVIRLLEDHGDLVTYSEEAISILQTLLNDQGLAEMAYETYERLSEWRRVKLDRALPSGVQPSDDG
jgi:hypothetical protein